MAQGNLLILPRRVVFEGTKRIDELNLANSGHDTARYVISLMHLRMKEDGNFEEITQPDSGAAFADRYLRFFPHSVTLGPNESQVVKIQLIRLNELAAGEYRSHIYFRAIPHEKPLGEKDTAGNAGISVRLVPVFGISIPVIIRVGNPVAKVDLSDLSLEIGKDSLPVLKMIFHRAGNSSVYGNIAVDYIPVRGKSIRVGTVNGMAVYTPNPIRQFRLPLDETRGIDYHTGKLHIAYTTPSETKFAKIAEAELVLH